MAQTTSFSIDLDSEGQGGHFRYKNAPGEVHRKHIVDRGDKCQVIADLLEVVHGAWEPSEGDPATLIICRFEFIPARNRRFKAVNITIQFELENSENETSGRIPDTKGVANGDLTNGVEVFDISPRGKKSIHPTQTRSETSKGVEVSAQGGVGVAGFNAGGHWAETEGRTREASTTVAGTIRSIGRESGAKNTARWVLAENEDQRTGVPSKLQAAILLKRTVFDKLHQPKFRGTVEIKTEVDLASQVGNWFDTLTGQVPKDDPVIFDPADRLESGQFAIDPTNLGSLAENLSQFVKMPLAELWSDADR